MDSTEFWWDGMVWALVGFSCGCIWNRVSKVVAFLCILGERGVWISVSKYPVQNDSVHLGKGHGSLCSFNIFFDALTNHFSWDWTHTWVPLERCEEVQNLFLTVCCIIVRFRIGLADQILYFGWSVDCRVCCTIFLMNYVTAVRVVICRAAYVDLCAV